MWGRVFALAIATVVVVAGGSVARAEKLRKVHIESRPLGATVFLDTKDDPRGETPVDLELPPGTYSVIFELNEYDSEFAELVVPKPTKRDKQPVELVVDLRRSMARMAIEGAPPRALIIVDDDRSRALIAGDYEDGFDISAGPHHIVVELDDQVLLEDYVEVESAKFKTLSIAARPSGGGGDATDPELGDDGEPHVERRATPTRRTGPLFEVGPLVEVGWRHFTYQDSQTDTNLPLTQAGGTLLGLVLEASPFRLTGVRALHPLAVVLAAGFGIPADVTSKMMSIGPGVTTFWQRFQAGLRYRFTFASLALDLEAGYGGYVYRFNGNIVDIDKLPDASYQTVRLGGRLGLQLGAVTPFVGGENRIVLSGGALEDRYARGFETQGYAFRGGLDLAFLRGKIAARVEGSYSRFDWTFVQPPAGAMYIATGGTDRLFGLSFVLGYAY